MATSHSNIAFQSLGIRIDTKKNMNDRKQKHTFAQSDSREATTYGMHIHVKTDDVNDEEVRERVGG